MPRARAPKPPKMLSIMRGGLFKGARSGSLSLLVDAFGASFERNRERVEEVPDEWVVTCVGEDGVPSPYARSGAFWYLSRPGYEANREALEEAYLQTRQEKRDVRAPEVIRAEYRAYAEMVFRRRIEKQQEVIRLETESFQRKMNKEYKLLERLQSGEF